MTSRSRPGDTDGPLSRFRVERRMTPVHAVLWSLILLATVADMILTMTGLANGLREGNVILAAALSEFGVAGLWLVKFVAMLWLVAGWVFLSDRDASIFLALFASVTLGVVGYNLVVLASSSG